MPTSTVRQFPVSHILADTNKFLNLVAKPKGREWHLLEGFFFFAFRILVRLNTFHIFIGYSGFLICELLPIYPLSIFSGSFIFFLLTCGILMSSCPSVFPGDPPADTKLQGDAQVPYIKWCNICIKPTHILLYTLNHH